MPESISRNAERLLDLIEQRELAWLSWGRVDGVLTRKEVENSARETIPKGAKAAINELIEKSLLLDVDGLETDQPKRKRYRSRFAETVRLLVRVRQIFQGQKWQDAPQLVSDFRVAARPRKFPKREVSSAALFSRETNWEPGEKDALEQMVPDEIKLSEFQARALFRLRARIRETGDGMTIVSAGTGSGKTKAFYLPVLSWLAEVRRKAGNQYPKFARVIALYPRNELLKDQLTEALGQVHSIAEKGGPIISIGAYFGKTPYSQDLAGKSRFNAWPKTEDRRGLVCPYLRCPQCSADLVWPLEARTELLECPSDQCGFRTREGQVVLTRKSMEGATPDVLFTTTEMMNRSLSVRQGRGILLGKNASSRPRVLLMDEIHTYYGTLGAHVALLLRRFRAAMAGAGKKPALDIVGLSATLENPEEFDDRFRESRNSN